MAVGTIYATIPAVVAAAVGIYSFDRHSGSKEFGGGIRSSIGEYVGKTKPKGADHAATKGGTTV